MTPFHDADGVRIYCADVREWAAQSDEAPFHAMLTDPPYELGFMGRSWDRQKIAFQPETWAGLLEMLHPGAFCFSFASSRGWHRLACAVEDAGFVFHPSVFLFGFVQGQGFPKATRVDTAVDKAAGAEREVVGSHTKAGDITGGRMHAGANEAGVVKTILHTKCATDLARAWEGHRYGRQALKPAVEPVLCFQRPYAGKPVECITQTGAGALNIDGGRLKHSEPCRMLPDQHGEAPGNFYQQGGRHGETLELKPEGRWPANFLLQHLPGCVRKDTRRVKTNWGDPRSESWGTGSGTTYCNKKPQGQLYADADGTEEVVVWQCEPGCPVAAFDAQAGKRRAGSSVSGVEPSTTAIFGHAKRMPFDTYADAGPASRFYFNAEWSLEVEERIAGAMPVLYAPKAAFGEREAGLRGHIPCAGCGELNSLTHVDENGREVKCRRNPHPTVKPALSICKWLGSLLLPPAAYAPRRILVPFSGTGSEAIGAILASFEEVVLVEQSEEYCALAVKRTEYWLQVRDRERREAQPSLFGWEEVAAE